MKMIPKKINSNEREKKILKKSFKNDHYGMPEGAIKKSEKIFFSIQLEPSSSSSNNSINDYYSLTKKIFFVSRSLSLNKISFNPNVPKKNLLFWNLKHTHTEKEILENFDSWQVTKQTQTQTHTLK